MARDVGSYFEQLTQKARGGRRLDDLSDDRDGSTSTTGDDRRSRSRRSSKSSRSSTSSTGSSEGSSEGSSGGSSRGSGGVVTDALKDILGRGRTSVKKTAERVRTKRRGGAEPAPRVRTLPPGGVVTVEYSPSIDGDPDPGEVVWAWVPFEEDPEQGKDRPVVVIGRRGRNLVGVPLTTKRSDREAQISLGTGEWDPKRRQSYARIWRILDLDEQRTRREGAVLPRDRFDQVVEAVDEYYDVRRPTASRGSAADDSFDDDD